MVKNAGILLLLLLAGSDTDLFSQRLSHQVLVPVAGVTSTGNISYSQTIGETAVEIFSSSDYEFTQGFQQPGIKLAPETLVEGNGVDVYPNPAIDNLTIKLFGDVSRDFRIEVINITGTIIISERLSFIDSYYLEKALPLGKFNKGIYFVRVISTDRTINRTFKIEKL
ncbi:MAG: T9SS type A sorting domain-containing protein [Bacteroidetes bacterium]|nr:MAG: T9SS type A sorting domain-containing protein [Bacteroidota bacterium]